MSWTKTGLAKVEGDPWTAKDANAFPRSSELAQDVLHAEHGPDGTHLPPCPVAIAVVEWDHSTNLYTLRGPEGIQSIQHLATGRVGFTLAQSMASVHKYMATARPFAFPGDADKLPVLGYEEQSSKTTDDGVICLVAAGYEHIDDDGVRTTQWELVDCSFVLEVYGEHLA